VTSKYIYSGKINIKCRCGHVYGEVKVMVNIRIVYCEHCNYLPRARELMKSLGDAFGENIEVVLEPGNTGSSMYM
jgi:predicted Rdx family selenoprotein